MTDYEEYENQLMLQELALEADETKEKLGLGYFHLCDELHLTRAKYLEILTWQEYREQQLLNVCQQNLYFHEMPDLTLYEFREIFFPNNLQHQRNCTRCAPLIMSLFNENKNLFLKVSLNRRKLIHLESFIVNKGLWLPEPLQPYPDPNNEFC